MRALFVCAGLLVAAPALADLPVQNLPTRTQLKFVPPAELAQKPGHETPANASYTLDVTVQGVNAQTKQGWTITIPVLSYEIKSPRDSASGLPTGKRMHKPFIFFARKKDDSGLAQALARNEDITAVIFHFRSTTPNVPEHAF